MVDGFASSFLNVSLKKLKKGDKRPKDGAEASDQPSKKLQTSPLPPPPSEAQLISPFQSLPDPSIRFLPLPEGPAIDLAERVGRTALDGLSYIASAPQSYPIALPFPSLPFSEFATELERSLTYVSALASEARKMAEDDQASSAARIAKLEANLTATASEKARLEEELRAQREEAEKARGELKIAEEALSLRGRELERKDKDLVEKGKALEVCQADLDRIAYCVLYQMYASVQRQFNAEADLNFLEDPEKIKDALTYCRDKWAKELAVEGASPSASQATSIQQREEDARSKGTEVTSTLPARLGETIYPMKEDFIMVHLQHSCTHCCLLMVSGTRWVCNKCKNFQLCEKCYDSEQRLDVRERHPINNRDKHDLCPVEITDVSPDTKDKDEILESEFFDTRQAFLSLCQGNHYQYDTLRRAKHSSMMMLYHLHNPTAPAFVTTCNVCLRDVEAGQGWRCEECPEFDVCNACYKKDGGIDHPHPLTNYPTTSERDAQNQEARQQRVVQLRKMLELLVHASQCRYPSCQYPNCRKVKGLFRHGINCKIRASGGCLLCKKMWYLLQLHARACKESECHVPRCKDLKDHLRRLQQQSDSRRRAAVMEMMRQRHAEVAGGND